MSDFWYQKVHCYISFWLDPLFGFKILTTPSRRYFNNLNPITFVFYVWRFISWISCDVPFCVYKIIIQPLTKKKKKKFNITKKEKRKKKGKTHLPCDEPMVIVVCPAWATNSNYNCKTTMIRLIWWNPKTSNHTTYCINIFSIGLMCCWCRQQHDLWFGRNIKILASLINTYFVLFYFWFLVLFC